MADRKPVVATGARVGVPRKCDDGKCTPRLILERGPSMDSQFLNVAVVCMWCKVTIDGMGCCVTDDVVPMFMEQVEKLVRKHLV